MNGDKRRWDKTIGIEFEDAGHDFSPFGQGSVGEWLPLVNTWTSGLPRLAAVLVLWRFASGQG